MKLLYITNQICGAGGLERVLSVKASYLADKLGYEVHLVTLNQNDTPLFYEFSERLIYHDLKVEGNFLNYFSQYKNALKSIAKKVNPDIILVCDDGLKGFFVPYLLGNTYPYVYERHASKDIFKNQDNLGFAQKLKFSLFNKLMHIGGNKYDAFVVLTNYNLTEWKLNNLKVIPNPLSFYPDEVSNLDNKKVIAVGNHGFQKGFDRLLKSWKIVLEEYPDWQLEIYGKIDSEEKHIKLAQAMGIQNNISFYNPVKNIGDKYKESSIYTMSSRSEGFGMVLIEAMVYGVPCVSYDCPCGPKDIISEGKDGFLINNGAFEKFADKIKILIKNETLRKTMGINARKKSKNYLPEEVVPQWDVLFKQLVENK